MNRPASCPDCDNTDLFVTGDSMVYCYNADADERRHNGGRCAVLPLRTVRFTRYTDSGDCDTCGMSMYDDGYTADTHSPDCAALIPSCRG